MVRSTVTFFMGGLAIKKVLILLNKKYKRPVHGLNERMNERTAPRAERAHTRRQVFLRTWCSKAVQKAVLAQNERPVRCGCATSRPRLDRGQWPCSTLPGCSVHTAAMQPCPSSTQSWPFHTASSSSRRSSAARSLARRPRSSSCFASRSCELFCETTFRACAPNAHRGCQAGVARGRDAGVVAQAAYRDGLLLREPARPREARHDESRRGAARLLVAGDHPAASALWASSRALALA